MNWFSKSPFGHHEDPVEHMLDLLSHAATRWGIALTDQERTILRGESSVDLPDDLRDRVEDLIARILHAESDPFERDPKSFTDSIQWADPHCPNIVTLAEEVSCEMGAEVFPSLRGWNRVKDKMQLVGCGCLVVLLMFAAVTAAGYLFGWK